MRSSSRLQPPKASPTSSRRSPNLHLPGLPRFHPANYPTGPSALFSTTISSSTSASSSTATSPPSNLSSPQIQASTTALPRPQYHARQYSDAQRQLYAYQREFISLNQHPNMTPRTSQPTSPTGSGMRSSPRSPRSPRLHPLGSPGPVTPLELEEQQQQQRDGYLFAGAGFNSSQLSEDAKDQILESFIQKETSAARGGANAHYLAQAAAQQARSYKRGDHTSHRSALSRGKSQSGLHPAQAHLQQRTIPPPDNI